MITKQKHYRGKEAGNVLFLILIAVALFAALSYAVTSSNRAGSGSDDETSLIGSAQLTQYPAGIRTSLIRMIVGGTPIDQALFDPPSEFASDLTTPALQRRGVFHPSGGGAVYSDAPLEVMADGANPRWTFNVSYEVPQLGLTDVANLGGDLIAYLTGITLPVCRQINEKAGFTNLVPPVINPALGNIGDQIEFDSGASTFPTSTANPADLNNGTNDFVAEPFMCFENGNTTGTYVFYHVLIER